ncbi:MAG: inositol monophosphatase [Chloroflexota bacterium]|nr:inositol monophosphatase [Chloroflexota bacterium]MEC9286962.1 inositol monophosphatase [Chloroflexota bacterium]
MNQPSKLFEDDVLACEIEAAAVEMAQGAGDILAAHFGRKISIEYKDKEERDPVTEVDKACQDYLVGEINRRFPDHSILGEEQSEEEAKKAKEDSGATDPPCGDFLWVLDPLDGTTNFLNGLPVYAVSVGVLHKGRPLAGALFIPWPKPGGGFVLHCRQGGGCFAGEDPVEVYKSDEPVNNRLAGLPGHFSYFTKYGKGLQGKSGEPRTTGSIAYELAMTACGVMQYAVFGAPRMWDMAAGALAVMEAGGTVMTRSRKEKGWHVMESFVPTWQEKPPTLKELRRWVAPLVVGNNKVAPLLAANLRSRFHPMAKVRRITRRFHWPKKKQQKES